MEQNKENKKIEELSDEQLKEVTGGSFQSQTCLKKCGSYLHLQEINKTKEECQNDCKNLYGE